jgi:hypothetical protein
MPKFHLLVVAMLAGAADAAVSSAEKKEMLDLHNMYRCMAGVPALKWDDTLQKQAQSWADLGKPEHSTSRGAFKKYGENMHYSCPHDTPETATKWWYAEIEKYSPTSYFQSSHYTQMVWASSTKIGCGKGPAPCGGDLWFCQFTKMGNWNMPGTLKANVIAPTKSMAEAKAGKCAAPPPADKSGGGGGGGVGACTPGFLCKQKGKSASAFDNEGYCKSMGKSYNGHGWSASGGVAKISVTCSGAKFNVKCAVSGSMKIKSCTGPGAASLYSSNVPNMGFAQSSAMLGAAAFFAATAFFTVAVGFRRWQAGRVATLEASEGYELEPLEAGESLD